KVVFPKPRKAARRKTLTETNVLRLPRKPKQYLTWDAGTDAARGLAVLVSPRGAKSFRAVYYFPGSPKPHWMHLGRVGEMTLADARQRTRDARGKARQGEDPTANDASKSDAFGPALERYIKDEQIGRHGNKSAKETQQVILKNCAEWIRRPVATLRYAEVDALLTTLRDGSGQTRGKPYLANRLYAHLKDFFGWATSKRLITT